MAEFLIRMGDVITENSDFPCYCRGDIIDVREDGFKWGICELTEGFKIVKIPNKKHDDLKKYIGPWILPNGNQRACSRWKYDEKTNVFIDKEHQDSRRGLKPTEL